MISRFFIDRPIFASVVSMVITLIGGIALFYLPIAQYPRITPPGISISISYPGASAQIVADTVAAPIEQQVNGVEGMLYMSSQMGNDGSYALSVTFEIGTDLNTALVMVQNRIALAMPQLPTEVQLQGITIRKKTPDILQVISFYSPNQRYNDLYLSNFATIYIRDELLRVDGVSDINYFGERDYSIRVWLDPQKIAAYNITAMDVTAAVQAQNLEVAPGRIGQSPTDKRRSFQFVADALGRLNQTNEFEEIVVKSGPSSLDPAFSTTASAVPTTTPTGTGPPTLAVADMTGTSSTSATSSSSGTTSSSSTSSSSSGSSTSLYTFGSPGGTTAPGATGGGTTGGPGTSGGAASTTTNSTISETQSMTPTPSAASTNPGGGGGGNIPVTAGGMVGP